MTDVRRPRQVPGTDGRSAMARVSDGLPPKFYDPARGRAEPPAVIAARRRHRAVSAEIERRARAANAAGPPPAEEPAWCRDCGHRVTAAWHLVMCDG